MPPVGHYIDGRKECHSCGEKKMLAPHELKNAEFSKSLRGYSTAEVDEHIEFLIEKYTELYRLNDELEKKLRITEAQLDALKAEEESIKITLVNAQKASTRIINEANERADVIMRSAKSSCDKLIQELKDKVAEENARLREAQAETASFKAALFEAYREHIAQIEAVAPDIRIENNDEAQATELSRQVLEQIRTELEGKDELISGSDDPFTPVNEDNDTVAESGISAEESIPEDIDTAPQVTPDEEAFSEARDSEEDLLTERTVIIENGSSLLDSIRKISENAGDVADDDEFLSMLSNEQNDGADATSTDEFDVVYDGKKKRKK